MIEKILRQTAASESFRYIVERRHLVDAANEIDRLRDVEQHLLDEIAYLKGAIQERDKQAEREAELQDGIRSREQGWG